MKIRLILPYALFALLCTLPLGQRAWGQAFGHEWINFNQQYWKIPTTQTGIYQINRNDLLAAGFPVAAVDPRRIQLFHRGQEQALFISGEGNAVFDEGEYVQFYGQRNDGTLDAELYQPASAMPHSYYNLYSDTTAYFLTWRLDNGFGKRMANFYEAPGTLAAEPFYIEENLTVLANEYSAGQLYDRASRNEAEYGHYDVGEGWTDAVVPPFASKDYPLTGISNVVTTGPKPTLEIVVTGRANQFGQRIEILAGPSADNLRSLGTLQFQYYTTHTFTGELEWADLGTSGSAVVRMRVISSLGGASVSLVRLKYPRAVSADGAPQKFLRLRPVTSGKALLQVGSPAAGTELYDVTDTHTVRRISSNTDNGSLVAVVDGAANGRTLLLMGQPLPLPAIRRVRFRNINPAAVNYVIITHPKLMKPAGGYNDAARAYGAYRASAAGGGYDTLVADVDLLYNQFSYGELTPLAFRRLAAFLLKNGKPEHLLLMGKSYYPQQMRKLADRYTRDLVPTGGYPGSDIALTVGLEGLPHVPGISTGRLSVTRPEQVISYLNKVKEHEATAAEALWRKDLLHLSGGRTQFEIQLFRMFLDSYKQMAEGEYLGGQVSTLSKKTDNTIELINISEQVNRGVSLVTFFGHSSRGVTDIEIGKVSNDVYGYRNKGKYPMLLVNGCQAGDIFSSEETVGEDWLLAPDRGAILFMAHSGIGYSLPLQRYSHWFYEKAFRDSLFIGKPVGMIQKESIKKFAAEAPGEDLHLTHAELITLQGDPAVSLAPITKPDYATSGDKIFLQPFDNSVITAVTDSFRLGIVVSNFGRISRQQFPVTVRRILGDGTAQAFDTLYYNPVTYQDTLYFTIRTGNVTAGGSQRFEVYLDAGNRIDELNEQNNVGVLEYVMPAVGAVPLLPREYSIVSGQPVAFTAHATASPLRDRDYLIELDTTHTFNSPGKRTTTVRASLLPTWTTSLLSTDAAHDSTVYYWRIRYADLPEGPDNTWAESSFIYINNSPEGWSQSRFPQFSKASLKGVVRNPDTEQWEFTPISSRINVATYGPENQEDAYKKITFRLNDHLIVFDGRCHTNNFIAVAFNKATTQPYAVIPSRFCGGDPRVSTALDYSFIQSGGLDTYLDKVPEGDYVLLFTTGTVYFNSLAAKFQSLLKVGADPAKIATLQNGHPYIILGRKGAAAGTAIEILAVDGVNPLAQGLSLETTLHGRNVSGSVTSSIVGPASQWGTLYHAFGRTEAAKSDSLRLQVLGIDLRGNETVVLDAVRTDALSLAESIDAGQYPYLKLRLLTQDSTYLTPAPLKRWQVIYAGVPEGLINPEGLTQHYQVPEQTEGQEFALPFVFQNISARPFKDSLTVQCTVINPESRRQQVTSLKIAPLAAGTSARFTVPVQTIGFAGNNRLQVFVNPRLQPEQNYANNIFEVPFRVSRDRIHPVLDVTFDGVRIMDGDIVSPSPMVAVSLKDENKVQVRRDTVGLELYLKKPCGECPFERISLGSADVRWAPAGPENNFLLEYTPKNLPDGTYTLRVQGSDVSGNVSGTEPYQIRFEVVNESRITHFYPYPNPFSSNTRFVFTLTGADVPDQVKIQIMTVSGKVVREITQDELGPIRIGHNVSSYAWEGTDEFGDKLANGVYLYRVITKINGQSVEHRATAGDKAFKHEYGKLYILR
jgi:hypothetical protein